MSIRKSVAALERLQKSAGLSEDGKNWLITAVDPFHDTEVPPTGYPDVNIAAAVPTLVKQSVVLTAPAALADGTTWDAMIYNGPWLQASGKRYSIGAGGLALEVQGGINSTVSGITCAYGATGNDLSPLGYLSGTQMGLATLSLPDEYLLGPTRVVAQGFEITNTTSDLYKQGSVTVFRQPQPTADTFVMRLEDGGAFAGNVAARYFANPPRNLAEAEKLLGSRTWAAREGAYCIPTLNTSNLGAKFLEPKTALIVDSSTAIDTAGVAPGIELISGRQVPPMVHLTDFNTAGAYFTGLSKQTSLRVTWNVYLERFPTVSQPVLMSLARPSPSYDPVALELYARMLHEMPVAVMVKDNGLGTWFANVVAEVAPHLSGALAAPPHPVAQAASAAVNAAGKIAGRYAAPPNSKGDPLRDRDRIKRKKAKAKARAQVALSRGKPAKAA